jgi:alpha-L-fucosidase
LFDHDFAAGVRRTWLPTGARSAELSVDLGRAVTIGVARLEEDIAHGQYVGRYTLYGAADSDWQLLSHGSTIGYAKLDRFAPVTTRRVRLTIEDAVATPERITLRLYQPTS